MTDKSQKYRPPHIRAINALGAVALSARLLDRELDADRLMAQARRRTGLEDFGPDDFLEPLRLLIRSYNTEAQLNFIGWMSAKSYLLQLLENRLRVERDRKTHPEIALQKIKSPVFILGLPRTGSTLLFELMAQNAALRVPLSWEVMLPSPPPRQDLFDSDPRITRARRMFKWLDRIAPNFRHIHEINALRPQECLAINAQAFRSLQFHTTHHVPTYQQWLDDADLTPAYEYHRRMLQHFQAFGPQGTWLLKAPAHIFGIQELFRVYPDARIVQTHRDPQRVIGSISSHCVSLRQAFSEALDLEGIGATWSGLWSMGLQRTLDFRRAHPEYQTRFLDLPFEDLVSDPLAAAQDIHKRFSLPWEQKTSDRMRAYLATHHRERPGTHQYHLEDYGLNAGQVTKQFGIYSHTYAGPRKARSAAWAGANPVDV